jgi:hypothetical protein
VYTLAHFQAAKPEIETAELTPARDGVVQKAHTFDANRILLLFNSRSLPRHDQSLGIRLILRAILAVWIIRGKIIASVDPGVLFSKNDLLVKSRPIVVRLPAGRRKAELDALGQITENLS